MALVGEGETEGRQGKVGIDVDILTMPGLQNVLGLATEQTGLSGCSKLSHPVAYSESVLGPEGDHSDIYCHLGRRTPHHRRCQNLTAGANPGLAADYLGLESQEVHTALEAHAHNVVGHSRGKTSSQFAGSCCKGDQAATLRIPYVYMATTEVL